MVNEHTYLQQHHPQCIYIMDFLKGSLRLSLPFWVPVDVSGSVDVDETGGEVVFGAGEFEAEDPGLGVVDLVGDVDGGG